MKWRSAVVLSIALAGCSTGGTERAGSTTQPAAAVPVQIPAENAPALPNSDAFDTTLSPRRAAESTARLFQELGIIASVTQPNSIGGSTFPFVADYFSAHAQAQTATGEEVDVTCRWLRDGQTRVLVKSNLPAVQQGRLVQMLRDAMSTAATLPAGLMVNQ